jgi:hypothetical protein
VDRASHDARRRRASSPAVRGLFPLGFGIFVAPC